MRISDWSSDVCSSDLPAAFDPRPRADRLAGRPRALGDAGGACGPQAAFAAAISWLVCRAVAVRARRDLPRRLDERVAGAAIGRASCRDRVWQFVSISVGAVTLKQKKQSTYANTVG